MGGPFPCWLSIVSPGRSKVGRVAGGVLEESFSGCEVSPAAVPLEFEAAFWPLAVEFLRLFRSNSRLRSGHLQLSKPGHLPSSHHRASLRSFRRRARQPLAM